MTNNPKLGRGLSALMGDIMTDDDVARQKLAAAKETSIEGLQWISPKNISPGPWQPRQHFDDDEIERLAESLRTNGMLQPILVAPSTQQGFYSIIAGERRWRASIRAQLEQVPAIVKKVTDQEGHLIAIIENIQREGLSPVEEAEGYQRIINQHNFTQEQISETVGKSRSYIANTLRLLSLSPSVRGILQNGEISAGHARCLIGLSEERALQLIDDVIQKKLNVRQLEKLVTKGSTPQPSKKQRQERVKTQSIQSTGPLDPELESIRQGVETVLGLPVNIEENGGSGVISLHFETMDQLDELMKKLLTR